VPRGWYGAAFNFGQVQTFSFKTITLCASDQSAAPPPPRPAPDTRIVSDPIDQTRDRTPTFAFASNVQTASFECSVDGGPFTACASPFTTPKLSRDDHSFGVRAVAGGVSAASAATDDFKVKRKHR
jgi:hypothetical protein